MKKFLLALALAVGLASGAEGAVTSYFVDGGCTNNGDGTKCDATNNDSTCDTASNWVCAASGGGAGPKNSLSSALSLLTAGDKTLIVRGVHTAASHTVSSANHAAGTYDARIGQDWLRIQTLNGTSGHPIVIQNFGYDGTLGSGEAVYIEGTDSPGTWNQCTDCSGSGDCPGVTGNCGDVWWIVPSTSFMSRAIGAQRPDGSPTYRLRTTCTPLSSCLSSLTSQFMSYSAQTTGTKLYVRWGTGDDAPLGANNLKPYVFFDNNGFGFAVDNSSYITINGFNIRCTKNSGIIIFNGSDHVVLNHNIVKYSADLDHSGSDYGIDLVDGVTDAIVNGNDISYTGSEGIHGQAKNGLTHVWQIVKNWIHDIPGSSIMGPGVRGTPTGAILGNDNHFGGSYTGSVFEDNVISNIGIDDLPSGSDGPGKGLILENSSSGWTVRNNFFDNIADECIKIDAIENPVSTRNNIFRNTFSQCGRKPGANGGASIFMITNSSTGGVTNTKIVGNTFHGFAGAAVKQAGPSALFSSFLFRNNLVTDTGGKKVVDIAATGSTLFMDSNVFKSSKSDNDTSFVNWKGGAYSCSTIANAGLGNFCPVGVPASTVVVDTYRNADSLDFRLTPYSYALDGGNNRIGQCSTTSTTTCITDSDCPGVETCSVLFSTGMSNTIASAHSFPRMDEGAALGGNGWDRGAFELRVQDGGFENTDIHWTPVNEDCTVGGAGIKASGDAIGGAARHGQGFGSIQGSNVGNTCGWLQQTLANLDTARTYTISGFYEATGATAVRKLSVRIDDVEKCAMTSDASTWAAFPSCTFQPAGTTAVIKLYVGPPAAPVLFNVDDVSVNVSN